MVYDRLHESRRSLEQALQELVVDDHYNEAHKVLELLSGIHNLMVQPIVNYGLTKDERRICDQGRLIEAIKEVRARLSLGLKEAKDMVEAYRDRNRGAVGLPPSSDYPERVVE